MTCRDYEKRLDKLEDYLEGRLDREAAEEISAHLAGCAACRESMEGAPLAGRLLRAAMTPAGGEASGAFWTRLGASLRAEEQKRWAIGEFWASLEAVGRRFSFSAGLLVLALGAYLAGSKLFDGTRAPGQSAETREIFQEPEQPPASQDEVLLTLAARGDRR